MVIWGFNYFLGKFEDLGKFVNLGVGKMGVLLSQSATVLHRRREVFRRCSTLS